MDIVTFEKAMRCINDTNKKHILLGNKYFQLRLSL